MGVWCWPGLVTDTRAGFVSPALSYKHVSSFIFCQVSTQQAYIQDRVCSLLPSSTRVAYGPDPIIMDESVRSLAGSSSLPQHSAHATKGVFEMHKLILHLFCCHYFDKTIEMKNSNLD